MPADHFLYYYHVRISSQMNVERSNIKRILIIKLRAIGDVLLSTVVINNLRSAFPGAEIDFLTEAPSREVVEENDLLTIPLKCGYTLEN